MRMLGHHFAFALRVMTRHRTYAAISIGGLALGLAGCLMILSYVRYERGYDRWLPDNDRVYQVQTTTRDPGQPVVQSQGSPFPVHDTLMAAFPEIEALTVVRVGPAPTMRNGEPVFISHATVDPSFFTIFDLPFAHGSAATALADTNGIVLTEAEAIKQFGTADVLGRTLTMGAGEGKKDRRISAVLRDLPKDSSLKLALLVRNDPTTDWMPDSLKGWGAMSQWHYVRLRPGADVAAVNARMAAWENRVIPPAERGAIDMKLVPLADVHLGAAQQASLTPGGDPRTLATFMIVALLTLGMAVMNFVNLATARATQRAREVALRRVLGATRRQLIQQMLVESLAMTALAMLLALTVVELATPWVAHATGADLHARYLGDGGMLLPAVALWLLTGLAGGVYPALYISRFRPGDALRANRSAGETPGSARLRAALVVGQFAVAIGLIASTWVIESQTHFIATADPGYRRDAMIQLDSAWRFAGDDTEYRAAKRAMLAIPGVVSAGRTNLALAATIRSLHDVRAPGAATDLSIGTYAVDPGFFDTMKISVLAGRRLGDRFAEDRVTRNDNGDVTSRSVNVVVNRAAAHATGFADPDAAIGKTVTITLGPDHPVPATIVGVVADTRIRTPQEPIEPIVYLYDTTQTSQVLVRYVSTDPVAVMAGIHKIWRQFEPEIPFEGRFGEDILAETYAAERARGALFAGFSALAIAIACFGLYGLAAFVTQRRTREIGLRKVLGAKVRQIVQLLAWQFSKPVILANLVAWPVAYWAMRDWLNTFDLRIALTPGPFFVAGILALAIAVGTVAGHALRVARLSPIHALRYE